MEYLFTYGTLQDVQVQHYIFQRKLKGQPDTLPGFKRLENVVYDRYPLVIKTGHLQETVEGTVYEVSEEELHKADVYETSAYHRVKLSLLSGKSAWVYIENSH